MSRILIVDDKEENLYFLRVLLTASGHTVDEARHGAEALVRARAQPPDLVISDLLMPVMDGYTLLRRWRADGRLGAIPFVVYTATYTEPQDEQLALDLGADAFILKPAEPDAFFAQVGEVLDRRARGKLAEAREPTADPVAHLQEYNEALVRKLESKMQELERVNRVLTEDIGKRQETEALLNGQKQVLETIALGAPLPATLDALVRLIESRAPGMLGSILLLDEDGVHVRQGAAPSLPAAFNAAVDGQPIGPRAGSCGTAAHRKEAVIVEDIATDPLWADYRAAALAHGLRACWSTPILDVHGKVLGTFAMYYRQPGRPQPEQLQLIGIATHTASIAISRHRIEAALRASEARFRAIIEASPVAMAINDDRQRITLLNRKFVELFGYTQADLPTLAEWWPRAYPDPAYRQRVEREWSEAVATARRNRSELEPAEYRVVAQDGTERDILFSMAALGDSHLVVFDDMTAINRAGAKLRESEDRFRRIFDEGPVGIATGRLEDGRFIRANAVLGEMLGYAEAELRELTFSEVTHLRFRDGELAALRKLQEGTIQTDRVEKQYVRKDGAVIWGDRSLTAIRSADGRSGYALAMVVDITQRKQAEEALRNSEARLRLSVAASNIGLWDWDLLTNEVLFSREWKSQLGYAEDEIANRFEEWESRVHPDDLGPALAKVQRFLTDPGADYAVEFRLRHKDGSYRWIFTQGQLFRDAGGKPTRMLGCHIDITARKLTEAAVRESEQKLRKVLDGLGPSSFVGLLEPDGTLLEANQPALEAAGLRREDVLGRPVEQTYWFGHSAAAREQVRASAELMQLKR